MSWALPLQLEPDGSFPRERPDPLLDGARLVLSVAPRERRLEPDFGWAAHRLAGLDGAVEREVAAVMAEDALRRWVPELAVERVEVAAVEGRRVRLSLIRGERSHELVIDLLESP